MTKYILAVGPFLLILLGVYILVLVRAYKKDTSDSVYRTNGSGLAFLGRRDVGEDGSYISTKWVCFMCIPIAPVASYRIWDIHTARKGVFFTGYSLGLSEKNSFRSHRIKFNLRQVLNTYLVLTAGFFVFLVFLYFFGFVGLGIFLLLLTFLLVCISIVGEVRKNSIKNGKFK